MLLMYVSHVWFWYLFLLLPCMFVICVSHVCFWCILRMFVSHICSSHVCFSYLSLAFVSHNVSHTCFSCIFLMYASHVCFECRFIIYVTDVLCFSYVFVVYAAYMFLLFLMHLFCVQRQLFIHYVFPVQCVVSWKDWFEQKVTEYTEKALPLKEPWNRDVSRSLDSKVKNTALQTQTDHRQYACAMSDSHAATVAQGGSWEEEKGNGSWICQAESCSRRTGPSISVAHVII